MTKRKVVRKKATKKSARPTEASESNAPTHEETYEIEISRESGLTVSIQRDGNYQTIELSDLVRVLQPLIDEEQELKQRLQKTSHFVTLGDKTPTVTGTSMVDGTELPW